MSFTLTTLTASVQEWTQNDESTFVAEIPFFIQNAEERIFKVVDLEYFRKNATGVMTSGNKFLQKPSDWLANFSLSFVNSSSENVFLLQKDVNYLQEFHPNPSSTGTPRFYASFDVNNFILAPTPNSNFTVEVHYYYRPASLTKEWNGSIVGKDEYEEKHPQLEPVRSTPDAEAIKDARPDTIVTGKQ